MASPILDYHGKYDGPQIDEAVAKALLIEDPEKIPTNIEIVVDEETWVLTIVLCNQTGDRFASASVDLPIESMVVNAEYSNGNIVLKLQNGNETAPIPISALINGLVNESRTIAELDLKDDITIKELRDKLEVYTTASVDQLIEELEDTINDRLSGIDEDVDKLYTDVEQNKTDILNMKPNILIPSSKTISGSNWYRVFSITPKGTSKTGLIMINRNFGNNSPENYLLAFGFGYKLNKINLINKFNEDNIQLIDNIRVVYANSSPNTMEAYIDIHYLSNSPNPVYIYMLVGAGAVDSIASVNYTNAEVPDGYTSYEFDLTGKDVFERLIDIETALSQTQTE